MKSSAFELYTRVWQKIVPDPFIFALGLSVLVFVLALVFTDFGPREVLELWAGSWKRADGIWSLLSFSMQMCVILVAGWSIAQTPAVGGALSRLARLPRSCWQAVALVSFVSSALALFNWGLSLVAGGILARVIKERNPEFNYPLLASAGYSGLGLWHGGLSGSAPLDLASKGITFEHTVFSAQNLFATGLAFLLTPVFFGVLGKLFPRDSLPFKPSLAVSTSARSDSYPLDFPLWNLLFGGLGVIFFAIRLYEEGVGLINLYSITFLFLFLALLLHPRPSSFLRSVSDGARASAGIIVQFPFYAGIASVMSGSGLALLISRKFVELAQVLPLSETKAFALAVFASASLVNFFIPSGGGQWKVQSTFVVPAGREIGVGEADVCMWVAWGDQITNMVQPFWALPIFGITGLPASGVLAFSFFYMLAVLLPSFSIAILIFA